MAGDVRYGQIIHLIDQAKRDLILSCLVGRVLWRPGDSVPGSLVSYLRRAHKLAHLRSLGSPMWGGWVCEDRAVLGFFSTTNSGIADTLLGPQQKLFQVGSGRERDEGHDGLHPPIIPEPPLWFRRI